MKLLDGKPLYSATDLLNFLGCTHATALDVQVLGGSVDFAAKAKDEYRDLLSAKGDEHELAYLEKLKREGRTVVELPKRMDAIDEMVALTRQAMRDGAEVIEATGNEEMLPIEIDMERVQRTREVGLKGLGQPLKSFRDRKVEFNVYRRDSGLDAYLHQLGPLEKMSRGSRAGIQPEVPIAPRTPAPSGKS
jgi:hypothetical protein